MMKRSLPMLPQPHDLNAELGVLGSVLVRDDIMRELTEILKPRDFYLEKHAHVFGAMCSLHLDGKPIDVITLPAFLREKALLEKVGGTHFISSLTDEVSTSVGGRYYAEIVREKADRRRLILLCHEAEGKAGKASEDLSEIVSGLRENLGGVSQSRKVPLTPASTGALSLIDSEPLPREYIFMDMMLRKIVAGIVGHGAASKSFLLMILAMAAATGKTVLRHFRAVKPFKTLMLPAEDPQDEVHRRLRDIAHTVFPQMDEATRKNISDNLFIRSVAGEVGPLMELRNGNPVRSEWFQWLRQTIRKHPGLELLILDPKSMWYGLDENDNTHNTLWVGTLQALVNEFGLTILFSHHTNKALGATMTQDASRGGSALPFGCRWFANLKEMDEKTGKSLGIDNHRSYVEFDVSKSNYTATLPSVMYFKRGEHGVLLPADLIFERHRAMAEEICSSLHNSEQAGTLLTRRDVVSQKEGQFIRAHLKDSGFKVGRQELTQAIDFALSQGWIEMEAGGVLSAQARKSDLRT
ncbi:MAG: AAA family ATPase [Desulfobacterales bacterium]|nr:AAA family ATPase [Desulfobacterales bacterium]